MSATASFASFSEQVAKRFLQTIVVVDDEAFLQQSSAESAPVEQQLVEPSPRGEILPADVEEVVIASDTDRPVGRGKVLDAKLLIDSFAAQGLICAVLAPGKDEDLSPQVNALAENADVIVLDWTIHKDGGSKAMTIIQTVIERDRQRGGRTRLIVVYTGELNLQDTCVAPLQTRIKSLKHVEGETPILEDGSTRIVFCRKRHDSQDEGVVAFKESELPSHVIAEFAKFTGGILPNAAMAAIAAIRESTHGVLDRIHSRFDGSFLTHRILLRSPSDAEQFLFDLIGDELKCVLEAALEKEAAATADAIPIYVKEHYTPATFRYVIDRTDKEKTHYKEISLNEVLTGLQNGIDGIPPAFGGKEKLFRKIHPLFHQSPQEGKDLSEGFACLSAFRRDFRNPHTVSAAPTIGLGTVLSQEVNGTEEFFVCLQPTCNCLRLSCKLFNPLVFGTFKIDDARFDIVAPNSVGKLVKLQFSDEVFLARILKFKAGEGGRVAAQNKDGKHIIEAEDGDFNWIGDLRIHQAQRLAHRVATHLSRIGLDESEWQRKFADQ